MERESSTSQTGSPGIGGPPASVLTVLEPNNRWASLRLGYLTAYGLVVAYLVTLYFSHHGAPYLGVVSTVLGVPAVLFLPGYLALRLLRIAAPGLACLFAFSVGTAVFILMMIGLALNSVLPVLGLMAPLSYPFLLVAVSITDLALVTSCMLTRQDTWQPFRQGWRRPEHPLLLGGLVFFPIASVLGAISLNNGGSNWLTMLLMLAVAAYAAVLLISKAAAREWALYPVSLYVFCLSLLLAISLRGWSLSGHDILQEYQVFQLTKGHLRWDMSFFRDAYNACLSVTILPTVVRELLPSIPDQYVLRVVFQAIFAFVPVVVFHLAALYLKRSYAYMAALFFLAQSPLLRDFAFMTRQEIATLFYVLLLLSLALARTDLRRWQRYILATAFGAGMVLSHYSTTYIAIAVFALCLVLSPAVTRRLSRAASWLLRPLWRVLHVGPSEDGRGFVELLRPEGPGRKAATVGWLPAWALVAFLLLMTLTWNVWLTGTTQNLTGFSQSLYKSVTGQSAVHGNQTGLLDQFLIFRLSPDQSGLIHSYVSGLKGSDATAVGPHYDPLTYRDYTPQIATETLLKPRLNPRAAAAIYFLGGLVQKVMKAGVLIGAMWLMFSSSGRLLGDSSLRRLVMANLLVLVLAMVLPVISVDYDLMRAYQQLLVILAIPAVIGVLAFARRVSRRRAYVATAAVFVAYYLFISPFVPQLIGSGQAHMQLNNYGLYYNLYYTHESEIAAIKWLDANVPQGTPIYADSYAKKKIMAFSSRRLWIIDNVLPKNITKDSYVFADYTNVSLGTAYVFYQGIEMNYRFPMGFLASEKSTVYANGETTVFR